MDGPMSWHWSAYNTDSQNDVIQDHILFPYLPNYITREIEGFLIFCEENLMEN